MWRLGDVKAYQEQDPDFPANPTTDQFFDHEQFEAYRALGRHTMKRALKTLQKVQELKDMGFGWNGSTATAMPIPECPPEIWPVSPLAVRDLVLFAALAREAAPLQRN